MFNTKNTSNNMSNQNIYQFTVKNTDGKEVSLSDYKNKVLLIVNTASECGFTPQYAELEALYNTYKSKDFEILAFPSNDFGGQEPLNGKEISSFCQKNYGVTFPVFDKIVVKGSQANPLFAFLAQKKLNGNINSTPKWNFHKYLINKKGEVVTYYYSTTSPKSNRVVKKIEQLLSE